MKQKNKIKNRNRFHVAVASEGEIEIGLVRHASCLPRRRYPYAPDAVRKDRCFRFQSWRGPKYLHVELDGSGD